MRNRQAVAAQERIASSDVASMLDRIAAFVREYVVLSDAQRDALVLWIAHTHTLDAFDVTPYLAIMSPERRSGKSRLLDVLELLVARPWRAIEPSEAVVFRKIDAHTPTLLLDEVDAIFGRKRETTEGLRALLNAGNARGTKVPRCVGPSQKLAEFSVFCAKALAGIGTLPDTVADRSVPIAMKRKVRGESCARFRRRHAQPEAETLRVELEAWGETTVDALRAAIDRVAQLADDGGPLAALDDRAFEAWEPLLAVAALAGEAWEQRARAAALALSGERDGEPESHGLRLLADIRNVFDQIDDKVSSERLASELAADADAPWADWHGKRMTPRAVATVLRRFGIRPRTIKFSDGTTAKGYKREWFEDAWKRYAPSFPAFDPSPPSPSSSHAGLRPFLDASPNGQVTDAKSGANPHEHSEVTEVTAEKTGNGATAACSHVDQWRGRDDIWRCTSCEPPAFEAEVADRKSTPA